MSQPPPASTDRMPSTSAKNARTFSAAGENTIACIPVITARAYCFGYGDQIPPAPQAVAVSPRWHELALPEAPRAAHGARRAGAAALTAGVCLGPPADGQRDGGRYRQGPAAEPEHGGDGQRGGQGGEPYRAAQHPRGGGHGTQVDREEQRGRHRDQGGGA